MRVLFVNPAGGLGGSERSLLDLVQSLRETRPEIVWLSPWQSQDHGGRSRFVIARVNVAA